MIHRKWLRGVLVTGCAVAMTTTACSFQGVNSLPLPGTVGRGAEAKTYRVQIANVGTLESNAPVFIDDVVVGSVGKMTVKDWHAEVEVSLQPDVVVPANAVATVGQTSLLGSMHLALGAPLGQEPSGKLEPGATIPLNRASTYPSTEQTLSSLSVVVNGGGLGQIGDIIHNFNVALNGREGDVRELLGRLDRFVGTLDAQRDNIITSIESLNRLASTFAGQRDVINRALRDIPPALDVLIRERPRLTTALSKLGDFGDTAAGLINDTQEDLVRNLRNLEPALKSLADVGPELDKLLGYATIFPYTQSFIDRGIRGDYYNLFATIDLTIPRLKRTLMLGTRWEQEGAKIVPAPGDPYYYNYTLEPLNLGVNPPPPPPEEVPLEQANMGAPIDAAAAPLPELPPMPPVTEPLVPVSPPRLMPGAPVPAPPTPGTSIFAGPYPAGGGTPAPPDAPAVVPPAPGGGG
ncbi:mammalian cell entry protein [Mycobacterium sp. IS-1742]|uniref:MCE family protein n=1 Tax=Mycobacterium sp. IS-1742 TaxID=1772285 RepID=UPI00073FAC15|nr:MCE family protein [Mycobacterium sp. IS-1742]KUI27128.1 mammalian cell entry protein [Mycobacterium sp. IS-1742]